MNNTYLVEGVEGFSDKKVYTAVSFVISDKDRCVYAILIDDMGKVIPVETRKLTLKTKL